MINQNACNNDLIIFKVSLVGFGDLLIILKSKMENISLEYHKQLHILTATF